MKMAYSRKNEEDKYAKDSSDDLSEIVCDPCKRDETKCFLPAKGFCVDCSEYLCSNCYSYHKKIRALSGHQLKDTHEMPLPNQIQTQPNDTCVDVCGTHTGKILEYYCVSCDLLGCSVCMTTQHRVCDSVQYIPHIAQSMNNSLEYQDVSTSLSALLDELYEFQDNIKLNLADVEKMKVEATKVIKKQQDEIIKLFDKLKNDMFEKIDKLKKKDELKIQSISSKLETMIADISNIKSDIDVKHSSRQMMQLFIAKTKARHKKIILEKELDALWEQNKIQHYKFVPTNEFEEFGNKVSILGTLMLISSDIQKNVTLVKKISAACEMDVTKGELGDMCSLSKHQLLVTDVNNKSVKVLDPIKGKVSSVIVLQSSPRSIAKVNNSIVALTTFKQTIQFLLMSEDGHLTKDKEILVGGECRGIMYHRGKLFVTFTDPAAVKILDMRGTVIKCILAIYDGQPLFAWPTRIAISPLKSTMYVSDHEKSLVTRMTLNGQVLATVTDSDLRRPVGLTVDRMGTVYVSGWGSSNICQLSEGLIKAWVLLDARDGLTSPHFVIYCKFSNQLYIGGMNDNINIHIYKLD